jgi:sporulation protein YunB
VALAAAEAGVKNNLSIVINESVENILHGVSVGDLYERRTDSGQMSVSVNTSRMNEICNALSAEISTRVSSFGRQDVAVPYGALLGLDIFANLGPPFTVTLLYAGSANVDYNTRFEAVGINQVNYQVWLHVNLAVWIVNPLREKEIVVTRKYALVNTVFSGQVPGVYLDN